MGERLRIENSGTFCDKLCVFCKGKFCLQELRGVFADGGGGAEAGRFDACAVEEAGRVRTLAEDEFVPVLMGTKAPS